jgi:excinuclease ABC subunit C
VQHPGGWLPDFPNPHSPPSPIPPRIAWVLSEQLEFVPDRDRRIFAAVPSAPAVFVLHGRDREAQPYIGKTANLRRRLERLLGSPLEHGRRLNLRDRVHTIEFSPTGSEFESAFLLYKLLRSTFPRTYGQRLRLRFAPLVKLHLENQYPRVSVTTRLGRRHGRNAYYGPFPSRAVAERYANDSLDLFKMRRCVEDLRPDPLFPGCVYSEMKMCLAPCFQGCTDAEYQAEVARVEAFLETGGESLVREISNCREAASASLEFERAAGFHAQLEKIKPVGGQRPEIVRRIDQMKGVIVQASAHPEAVNLFRIEAGSIADPLTFPIRTQEHSKSQSMEARLSAALAGIEPPGSRSALEIMEHLALVGRWYYRSHRAGQIFLADPRGMLPLRRIVRGMASVYRGEKFEPGTGEREGTAPVPDNPG